MNEGGPAVKEELLDIGRKFTFPVVNTKRRSGDGMPFGKAVLSAFGGSLGLSLVLTLIAVFDPPEGIPLPIFFFASFGVTLPIGIWAACMVAIRSVDYTDTIDRFADENPSLIRMASMRPGGMIGRLIQAHVDTRDENDRIAKPLSIRDDLDNVAWGIESVDQGDHGFFIGRYYTTGPYRGFAHISIKMPASTKEFPQLIIDASMNNHNFTATDLERSLGKDQQYSLEGNFPDFFKVYALNEHIARVAYYVLTPDVMQILLQYAPEFDIEMDNNRLTMYWYDPALESELEPDWATFLPRAFWILEAVAKPLARRIELYRPESHTLGRRLRVDNGMILNAVRDVVYGRRQYLMTASARLARKSTMMAVGFIVLFLIVGGIIGVGMVLFTVFVADNVLY